MIIGITGPLCTGKSILSEMLIEKGFFRLSFAQVLRDEMTDKGLEIDRIKLQDYGNEMRKKHGADYFAEKLLAMTQEDKNYIVEGFRNPAEINAFRKNREFILIGLAAPTDLRLQWMISRSKDKDPDNIEDLIRVDARDRGVGEPDYGQQSDKCYMLADAFIMNNTSVEDLKEKITKILDELGIQ